MSEQSPGLIIRCVRRITLAANEHAEIRRREDGRVDVIIIRTQVDRVVRNK